MQKYTKEIFEETKSKLENKRDFRFPKSIRMFLNVPECS